MEPKRAIVDSITGWSSEPHKVEISVKLTLTWEDFYPRSWPPKIGDVVSVIIGFPVAETKPE